MNKIIEIAEKEVGYQSGKNHDSKYGKWFGLNGEPDCGMFVSWVYSEAGVPLGNVGYLKGFAGVGTALSHYQKAGEITSKPVEGDIVIMSFDGKTPQHVGLFKSDLGNGKIATVEADTSNPAEPHGSEITGGWVMNKERSKSCVMAYIHPKVLDKLNA